MHYQRSIAYLLLLTWTFADQSLGYTMKHLVDGKGLFWWGWHRHWDAYQDQMTGHAGNHHEIHVQRGAWPELWAVDRDAVTRQIEALWQWHAIDKTTGEVNRHCDGGRGCDFAMSAGEILRAFAFLYHQNQQPQWLDRARLLTDYYWQRRHPETDLIPNRPNAGSDRFDGMHRLTGQSRYTALARQVADEAITKLYHNGLFRGHPAKPYYESMDGVGTLLMALLELEQAAQKSL